MQGSSSTLGPLPYATPVPSNRSSAMGIWLAHMLLMFGGYVAIALVFAIWVQRFKDAFRDFKVELPGLTRMVLGMGDWVAHSYGWAALVLAAFGIPSLVWALSRNGRPRLALGISMLITVIFFFGLFTVTILAMLLPMLSLVETVSGGPKGQ